MKHKWKDIPGYEGLYQASTEGMIRSLGRYVKGFKGIVYYKPSRVLKGTILHNGYEQVTLTDKRGKVRSVHVHYLILITFVGERPLGMVARHYPDQTRSNNSVVNLSWSTQLINQHDRREHGTAHKDTCLRGSANKGAKLNDNDVRVIRRLYATGSYTQSQLAFKYKVNQERISRIVNNRAWVHVI